ncbi:hypothetical protein BH24CHL4_BH24CHL4_03450 [soil metagenome]
MCFSGLPGRRNQVDQFRRLPHGFGADEVVYVSLLAFGAVLWASSSQPLSIALLAGGALVSIWSPVGAFWACCAAIPFVYHPIDIGSVSVTLLELGLMAAIGGIGGRIVIERTRFSYNAWIDPGTIRWVWLGAFGLLVAGALAIAFQPGDGHVRESIRTYRWVIVEGIAAFAAARYALAKRGGERIVVALAIPAFGVSLWAIAELLLRRSGFEADGVVRATGSYMHPNNLALYLLRVVVLLGGAAALARPERIPRHWIAGTALTGLALAAALSRGALIGAIAGMLVIGWYARRRSVVLAAAGAVIVLPAAFLLFAEQRFLGGETSGIGGTRLKIWNSAIEMIRDYPISGIGLDQFLYQHNPRYIEPSAWSERYISHPHNLILDSWLSLGLPGLLLLAGAIIALARQMIGISRDWPLVQWWPAAAAASLTAGLMHALVDNGYFLPDLAVMTWILIALTLGPVCSSRPDYPGLR